MKLLKHPLGLSVFLVSALLAVPGAAQPRDKRPPSAENHKQPPPKKGKEDPKTKHDDRTKHDDKHRPGDRKDDRRDDRKDDKRDGKRGPKDDRMNQHRPPPPPEYDANRPPPPDEVRKHREEMRNNRHDRRRDQRDELRKKWGDPMLKRPEVIKELAIHAQLAARINYMEALAKAQKRDDLLKRIQALRVKYSHRHDARMERYRKGGN